MSDKIENTISKYFAAANSYNGFISFFDIIFPSEDFDRIFVLKGGPGTGKSSLMKKIAAALKEKNCNIDEIYCSSDPHSLDGIIAYKNNKQIAIIDGTAPHERDAVVPGAIDEIINLGECWDSIWLRSQKDKILSIGTEKAKAYKNGYSYLKIAGSADEYIFNVYTSIFNKSKAKSKAEDILSLIEPSKLQKKGIRLISSFGKYGYYRINENEWNFGRGICVSGDEYSSLIFIKTVVDIANAKGLPFVEFKSPLSPIYSEGLSFENTGISIMKSDNGEINSLDFLNDDKMYLERTHKAKEIKKDALMEAERWFSIASELHFQLEEIYGDSMNFDKNNEIFNLKLREIENILQI